jgi:hypothetical protein
MTEDLLGPFADMVAPEQVTPMVVYLCSEANEHSHEIFTVGGGRYGRVFIATNNGWFAGTDEVPSLEAVNGHMDEIRDLSDYVIPLDNNDEIMLLRKMLAG